MKGRAIGAAPDSGLAVPLGNVWLCVPAGWAGGRIHLLRRTPGIL